MAGRLATSYHEAEKRRKYGHEEFDDHQVESLAKYFKIDGYPNLCAFLEKLQRNNNLR